ncbi:MAG: hypothetical protein GY771_03570 [bacterium]|nr:hypothetical protein [bacterium]
MVKQPQFLQPKWLFYGLSFFVPVAGIVIGAIYMSRPDTEAKDFGKKCLTAAIAYFVAACCCIIAYISIYMVFVFVMAGTDGFTI